MLIIRWIIIIVGILFFAVAVCCGDTYTYRISIDNTEITDCNDILIEYVVWVPANVYALHNSPVGFSVSQDAAKTQRLIKSRGSGTLVLKNITISNKFDIATAMGNGSIRISRTPHYADIISMLASGLSTSIVFENTALSYVSVKFQRFDGQMIDYEYKAVFPPGDLNEDWIVNIADYAILAENWLKVAFIKDYL